MIEGGKQVILSLTKGREAHSIVCILYVQYNLITHQSINISTSRLESYSLDLCKV